MLRELSCKISASACTRSCRCVAEKEQLGAALEDARVECANVVHGLRQSIDSMKLASKNQQQQCEELEAAVCLPCPVGLSVCIPVDICLPVYPCVSLSVCIPVSV